MTSRDMMVHWTKDHLYQWIDSYGECEDQYVDLTVKYVKTFANFSLSGSALDYMKGELPLGWRRFLKGEDEVEPGDITIWRRGPFDDVGHVGIVLEVDDCYITSAEQSVDSTSHKRGVVRKMTRVDTYLACFIRPKYDESEAWTRIPKNGRFIVDVQSLNVRDRPSTKGKFKATFHAGETINYDSYVIKEGHIWISYISYAKERGYVATGRYNGKKRTCRWGRGIE